MRLALAFTISGITLFVAFWFVRLLQYLDNAVVWKVGVVILLPAIVAGWTGLAVLFDRMLGDR